jgi:KaiC/GvpD/RAD55 family RecA-like ATPase
MWESFSVLWLLVFVTIKSASGALFSGVNELPTVLQLFLAINIPLQFVTMAMLIGVTSLSKSKVWTDLKIGLFFNILQSLALVLLINLRYSTGDLYYNYIILILYSIGVIAVFFTIYFLALPLVKKIDFLNLKYVPLYILSLVTVYLTIEIFPKIYLPPFHYGQIIYAFLFAYLLVIIYFPSVLFHISTKYVFTGFVRTPFLVAGSGLIAILIFFILIVASIHPTQEYYYILILFVTSIFTLVYYLHFGINYPSLLDPRWKALLPFDLPKVIVSSTFAFLTISLYLTAKDHTSYITIPYYITILIVLPILISVIHIFNYMQHLLFSTKLKYWEYLKYGLCVHLAVTFYVFSLLFLSWHTAMDRTKLLGILFGVVSFLFYLFFALDLRTILKEQKIEPIFDKVNVAHTIITLYSSLFIVLFAVSFIYGVESYFVNDEIIPNPVLLFFVAFFLIAFGTYLSITHKGFEEILGKNIWSEFSYVSAFLAFLLIYFMYSSMGAQISRFPYHNLAFIGYFVVLIIEIVSTMTLTGKYQFTPKREGIVDLLNFHARAFLRTDYLEEYWRKTVSSYLDDTERIKVNFDPARRAFDLTELDENTQRTIAVSMLLLMHKLSEGEKIAIQRKSLDEAKGEIVEILREKILQLPEELRAEIDEEVYYPLLLEKSINDLLMHLGTFVPVSEHKAIFEGLRKRDEVFACVDFETDKIQVREGTRFGRDKFLELFKLYLDAVGDKFPFKRCLLRGLVKEEIRTDAHAPIAASEVFDIISTGTKELNLVMAGGLVKGSITLLITEETKAKQKILHALITRNLPEGMSIVYATSKRPYQQITGELLTELDSLDRVTMLDLYAPLYEEKGISELVEYDHRILVPLSKILFQRSFVKVIKTQPRNQPRLVIIDVYDDFAKYYQPDEIYKLLQTQVEGLKRWDCTTILVLDPHSHLLKKVGVDEVKKNFENILVLAGAEKETVVQIEKLFHGTPGKRVVHLEW